MRILFVIAMLFVTLSSYAQTLEMPNIKVEPIYKGEYKIVVAVTNSYPPHEITKVAGYDYQIKMKITFIRNVSNIDSLYGIVCILPDGDTKKLLFSSDSIVQLSLLQYEYSFPIRIKGKGWLRMFVAQRKDFARDLDVSFYENTSNKESYYLDAW